jgi:hypothetical protein
MDTGSQAKTRVSTGILTEGEREFLRGEKDVENPGGYRSNVRYRAKQRMDQIEEDLEVLREAGEDDLVEEFFGRFGRVQRLEREVEELRDELARGSD